MPAVVLRHMQRAFGVVAIGLVLAWVLLGVRSRPRAVRVFEIASPALTKAPDHVDRRDDSSDPVLVGVVLDIATGRPVAGARILLEVDEIPLGEIRSDEGGGFSFRCAGETARISVEGTGYQNATRETICAGSLTIGLERGVLVSGTVVFFDGTPAADAHVECRLGKSLSPSTKARTSPTGTFSLTCPRGELRVVAQSVNSAPALVDLGEIPARHIDAIVVRLPQSQPLTGRVVDERRFGVPAEIILSSPNDARNAFTAKTESDGSFQVFVAGNSRMLAVAVDGRSAVANVPVSRQYVELILPDFGGRIDGLVTGGGLPAHVRVIRQDQSLTSEAARLHAYYFSALGRGTLHRQVTTDAFGRFSVDVENGRYLVQAWTRDSHAEAGVVVTGEVATVTIALRLAASLDGTIRHGGHIAEGRIHVRSHQREDSAKLVEGRFSLRRLAIGPNVLEFHPAVGPAPESTNVDLQAGRNSLDWDTSGSQYMFRGVVRDERGPIEGVRISTALRGPGGWYFDAGRFITSRQDGSYELLVSRTSRLFMTCEGYASTVTQPTEDVLLQGGESVLFIADATE